MTAPSEEIRVTAMMAALLRQWRTIVRVLFVTVLIALAWYTFRPRRYAAYTSLVPAQTAQSDLSVLASQLNIPIPAGISETKDSKRLLGAIASSRLLADSMVQRLTGGRADARFERQVRKVLAKSTVLRTNPDGSIVIVVTDKDPKRAARIANEFPPLLNQIVTAMGVQVAERKLENLRTEMTHAGNAMQESQRRLVQFRQNGGAPVIEAQATQTVEAAGQVQRAVMEKELKIAEMRRTMTPENPQLQAALAELNVLRAQLSRLTADKPASQSPYVPMRAAPGIKAAELSYEQDYTRDAQIYNALAGAVAQTQIDMNDNLPIVSVLDTALVPTTPAGIHLPTLLAFALVLGLFLGLFFAVLRELWARTQRDAESRVLLEAWADMKRDLSRWLPGHTRRQAELSRLA